MRSVIVVHPSFEYVWPFVADHLHGLWSAEGSVEFMRLPDEEKRPIGAIIAEPGSITRLVTLGVPVTDPCIHSLAALEEAAFEDSYSSMLAADQKQLISDRGIRLYTQPTEGFWGQSVAEYGLALTLAGLRRIPQLHRAMLASHTPWDYEPPNGKGRPNSRGHQFGDDPRFTNGTVAAKRVRIVGAGNIASRYASFVSMLGADVAAWDPFASEASFHRAGARKEWHIERLVRDAEIFAPMLPLTNATRGLVTAELIDALPRGCLVILVTRADICDMKALRSRVLANELALAADVFDIEPLPLDDALLGRDNVVHTPHNAGRTIQANQRWAEKLVEQFLPSPRPLSGYPLDVERGVAQRRGEGIQGNSYDRT
jgi:phosphoglycerate dehydrogenase-like enzyme